MILVTGATGRFGSKAVEYLLKNGVHPSEISVLVRDAAKAGRLKEQDVQVREGDYADHTSMVKAFQDVERLLLVSSNDRGAMENRTQHHKNAIRAAVEAGVKHLVYTSFVRKPGFEGSPISSFQNSHVESEQYLKESGMEYTILQNGIYAEMIPVFIGDKVAESGTIVFPAGEGKASWVLLEELAEAASNVLTTDGHKGKTYTLTHTESVGFKTIAGEISAVLGRDIHYKSPEMGEFKTMLENAGVPQLYIGMFAMWAAALAAHSLDKNDEALTMLLGRKPTSVREFLKQIYS